MKTLTVILLAAVISFCLSHAVSKSWEGSARLSLLLHGHLRYHLVKPDETNVSVASHAGGFASGLVYRNQQYLGCLDPYGNFIPAGVSGPNLNEFLGIRTYFLMLRWISAAVMCIIGAVIGYRVLRSRVELQPYPPKQD